MLSKSATVWDLNGVRWVFDPETRTVITQGTDGAPVVAEHDALSYNTLFDYVSEFGMIV